MIVGHTETFQQISFDRSLVTVNWPFESRSGGLVYNVCSSCHDEACWIRRRFFNDTQRTCFMFSFEQITLDK